MLDNIINVRHRSDEKFCKTEKRREKKRKDKKNLAMTPTKISNERFRLHKKQIEN